MGTKNNNLLESLFDEFTRTVDFIHDKAWESEQLFRFSLPTYIVEHDEKNNSTVYIELPGLTREDLEINLINKGLNVKVNKKFTGSLKKYDHLNFLIPVGSNIFKNSDTSAISAKMENGILMIQFPQKDEIVTPIKIS